MNKFFGLALSFSVLSSSSYADKKVEIYEVPRILTYGVDARDYDEIAADLSSSILTDPRLPLGADKILAIGPIDDNESVYFFDRVTLQEKLQTLLQRSGKLSVTFADVEIQSTSAMDARTNIRQREFEKSQIGGDQEMFTMIGEIPEVDYILFGRRSTHIGNSGQTTEITHRFNWKIGDCKTGLILWTDEKTIAKSGKRLSRKDMPDWVQQPRLDSPSYRYALGQSDGAGSLTEAVAQAEAQARKALMGRLSIPMELFEAVGALEKVPFGQHPVEWSSGNRLWGMFRQPIDQSKKIVEAIELGKVLSSDLAEAKAFYAGKELGSARAKIERVLEQYNNGLMISFNLAEAQLLAGDIAVSEKNFMEARKYFSMAQAQGLSVANQRLSDLPAPALLSALNSRWNGQQVALFCVTVKQGEIARSKILSTQFYKEYKAAGLGVVDMYSKLLEDERTEWVEFEDPTRAVVRAKQMGAGILFSLIIDTSAGGGGTKTITLPNGITYEAPAMDSVCRYNVISTASGESLWSGSVEEAASEGLEERVASMVMLGLVNDCMQLK